jgi:TolB-like protein/DNA-binding winged helix-turn-helix (wHTH) protein/Flp pilus assembly protein TadD
LDVVDKPLKDAQVLRFGPFEVNFTTGEVRKQGIRLKVQDQPFQVLKMLLARPGGLVTREEIRRSLWPSGTFVDFDNGLNASVNRLREALGDSAESPKFIETLPRRGYRFIGVLDSASPAAGEVAGDLRRLARDESIAIPAAPQRILFSAASRLRFAIAVGVAAVLALLLVITVRRQPSAGRSERTIHTIAVLPLENLSRDPEQQYFVDGLTDQLITDLSQISALQVISRTSVMQYKGAHKPLSQVARELSADALVEGTVLRAGDQIRITAQLVQAASDTNLWADSYERNLRDVLGLQNEVARAIAERIKVTLTPQQQARLGAARVVNPAAYEAYLKGRFYWNQWTEDAVRKGIQYFQQALQTDSNYAPAYAGLADSYNSLGDFGLSVLPTREILPEMERAARKAIELDDRLADGHASLAMARFQAWDWSGAENEFQQAIELNASDAIAYHWYAHYLFAMGRVDEALTASKRAYELDPVNPEMGVHLQWHYYFTRQYQNVIDQGHKVLEMSPDFSEAHYYLGLAYEKQKHFPEAVQELTKAVELSGGRVDFRGALGHAYAVSGRRSDAVRLLNALETESANHRVSPFAIAQISIGLGDKKKTFAYLERALADNSYGVVTLRDDPYFDSIRNDARLEQLVHHLNLPH